MSHNFFVKFNLDKARHELAQCKRNPDLEYQWHRGFMDGAAGLTPSSPAGSMARMGEEFGYAAWQEANNFRATRAANVAKRWAKRKDKKTSNSEQLTTSSVLDVNDGSIYTGDTRVSEDDSSPGATAPDPVADRRPYDRFAKQYETPKPEPVVLPFEETPEGKACLARREALRAARRAREQANA